MRPFACRNLNTLLAAKNRNCGARLCRTSLVAPVCAFRGSVRVDREKPQPLSAELQIQCFKTIRALLPEIDAIIFEDYGKGFLQQCFVDEVCALARQARKVVTVDPNVRNKLSWRGVTAVKPNRIEAFAAANQPWHEAEPDPLEDELLLHVGNGLLKEWKLDNLLITLGEQGMILFDRDHPPYHAPSRAREIYDVSGAGDTAIALFTLAMVSGATPIEAAEISNHASSVVVAKLGTATLTPDELLKSFRLNNGEVAHIVPKDPLCVAEPSVTLTSPPKILGLRNRSHRPIKKGCNKLRRHTKKVFASAGIA